MIRSPYGLVCSSEVKAAVLGDPITAATLGEACLVAARIDGKLPDTCVGVVRRLGQECITHCLAQRMLGDQV